jgi:transposase
LVRDQRASTWLGCHRRAFEYFHGVPLRLIIDSLKSAITRACYYEPEAQRAYAEGAEGAEGYGFLLAPHPPREPERRGASSPP